MESQAWVALKRPLGCIYKKSFRASFGFNTANYKAREMMDLSGNVYMGKMVQQLNKSKGIEIFQILVNAKVAQKIIDRRSNTNMLPFPDMKPSPRPCPSGLTLCDAARPPSLIQPSISEAMYFLYGIEYWASKRSQARPIFPRRRTTLSLFQTHQPSIDPSPAQGHRALPRFPFLRLQGYWLLLPDTFFFKLLITRATALFYATRPCYSLPQQHAPNHHGAKLLAPRLAIIVSHGLVRAVRRRSPR